MCSAGPKYILRAWPEGYKMFVHYKGSQDNPRTDKYLFGVFPRQNRFIGPHDYFERRLDTRQTLSLGPRIRTPRCMAHDGRRVAKVQLRLQVLYAYAPTRHQPSSGLINRPHCFFPCCSDSPVDPSAFEGTQTSAPNRIPGRGEGGDISATLRDSWPTRNLTPSVAPTI